MDTTDNHSSDLGKTEAEIEIANGEIPGDRVGDTPVEGVAQTRNGLGELLAASPSPAPVSLSVSPNTGEVAVGGENVTTHIAVPVESVSAFRRLLDEVEHLPRELVAFYEAHFGHHAA